MVTAEKENLDLLFAVMAVPEGGGKAIEVTYIFYILNLTHVHTRTHTDPTHSYTYGVGI